MSKIKFYFILLIATITMISCNKDDDKEPVTPPIPYADQYPKDIAAIEDYLNTHYISEVVNNPGQPNDQDVTLSKITDAATQPSLMSYLDSPTLPRLTFRNVSAHGITYKIYTLSIREGKRNDTVNGGGEYPCNIDGVYAGYKGTLLDGKVFDSSNNGQKLWNLDGTGSSDFAGWGVIRGWAEGFPQFMTGWISSNADGTVRYNEFGVGVMFIPSGFGYYNKAQSDIPAYSPLIFSIKLYALKRYDHEINSPPGGSYIDPDGIPSFQEDLDGDRYIYTFASGVPNPDDTDGDGIPDCYDSDDDGDGYATKGEIKDAKGINYPFESIPDCSGDQTTVGRKKRYLDKDCIKTNQ
jgi:FKBP-type peptidyl-prolyl cis-trans isomerase FkpA